MYTYSKISMFVYRFLCVCPSNVVVMVPVSRSVMNHSILVWGTGDSKWKEYVWFEMISEFFFLRCRTRELCLCFMSSCVINCVNGLIVSN